MSFASGHSRAAPHLVAGRHLLELLALAGRKWHQALRGNKGPGRLHGHAHFRPAKSALARAPHSNRCARKSRHFSLMTFLAPRTRPRGPPPKRAAPRNRWPGRGEEEARLVGARGIHFPPAIWSNGRGHLAPRDTCCRRPTVANQFSTLARDTIAQEQVPRPTGGPILEEKFFEGSHSPGAVAD